MFCTGCGSVLQEGNQYCAACGQRTGLVPLHALPGAQTAVLSEAPTMPGVTRGFGQMFGLDPRVAFVTLVVDLMLNAGEIASMGLLAPVSIAAGIVVGYLSYKMQMHWYGDDKESAKIKGITLGLLTAIPTALPAMLYVPAGLIGWVHKLRKKNS
jgi:hypothetical protein